MNKIDPNKISISNEKSLERTYANNELNAKSWGCKIVDKKLYEKQRRNDIFNTFMFLLFYTFFFVCAGFVMGINLYARYAQ